MSYFKKIERTINVNGKQRRSLDLRAEIFSYDKQVSKFVITLENDEYEYDLKDANVRVFLEYAVDGKVGEDEFSGGIESIDENQVYFIVPERMRGYVGSVTAGLYVDLKSGEQIDIQNLKFKMSRSLIDEAAGPAATIYFESFDEIVADFKSKVDSEIDKMEVSQLGVAEHAETEKTTITDIRKSVETHATTEKNKVSSIREGVEAHAVTEKANIDAESVRVSAHADEKISEYDAKFTQSDTKMSELQNSQSALDTKLTETQKKITDADVFTKAESSANVIDQVIGKESNMEAMSLDFKDKVSGSLVENVNKIASNQYNSLLSPSNVGWLEFPQANIDKVKALDKELFLRNERVNGYMQQVLICYDVLAYLINRLGENFFTDRGAKEVSSQVTVIRSMISGLAGNVWGYGSGPNGNKMTFQVWTHVRSRWEGPLTTTNSTVTRIKWGVSSKNDYIDSTGKMYFLVNAEPSDGVTASTLNIDYVSLQFDLNVSANDYIKSMIAQYHRENTLPQLNDLASRIAALESK